MAEALAPEVILFPPASLTTETAGNTPLVADTVLVVVPFVPTKLLPLIESVMTPVKRISLATSATAAVPPK